MLSSFQYIVILGTAVAECSRHAIEAVYHAIGTGQEHVGQGARQTTVAIGKRMDGDKPKGNDGCFDNGVNTLLII